MSTILLIEDNDSLREVLAKVLESEGYVVSVAASAEEGLIRLHDGSFDLILSDLKLPKKNGLDLVKEIRALQNTTPIIVMTAYGTIEIAVEAMKEGASDFITKPFSPPTLCDLIKQILDHRRIIDRSASKRLRKFLTQSKNVEKVIMQAKKVAPISSSVLLLGESGTGKELVARYIHEQSSRCENTFVAVNCASMPGELLESEFFGHEAGSFTGATEQRIGLFEVANNGTLFLDEIGTMPTALQTKLLRALQESEIKRLGSTKTKKINVRVISATNCDLQSEIKKGTFREDLFYRLGVVILEIPPLRERKEDIELLATYFAKIVATESKREVPTITPQALKLLESYHWPGNVRELENVIERAIILHEGPITPETLELIQKKHLSETTISQSLPDAAKEAMKKAEVELISRVLIQTRGNKSKAAQLLGVSYKTLLSKVKEYKLEGEVPSGEGDLEQPDAFDEGPPSPLL